MKLVRRWEGSGESQQAVANAAGVSVHTLRYWVAKLRADRSGETSDFVEVVRAPVRFEPQSVAVMCRIRIGACVVLELDSLPPPEWVRSLSEGS